MNAFFSINSNPYIAVIVTLLILMSSLSLAQSDVSYTDSGRPYVSRQIIVKFSPNIKAYNGNRFKAKKALRSKMEQLKKRFGVASSRQLFTRINSKVHTKIKGKLSDKLHSGRFSHAWLKSAPGQGAEVLDNVFVIELPDGVDVAKVLALYRSNPEVVYAQPNYLVEPSSVPDDPLYGDLWGLDRVNAAAAWDITEGEGVVVAVVDSGVDVTHEDLAGRIWQNPGEVPGDGLDNDNNGFVDDVSGWNFAANNNTQNDLSSHGTHVAGIIAATGNNGVGVIGVAPKATIMPVQIKYYAGGIPVATAAEGLIYAVANGADVINCSWAVGDNELIEEAVASAVAMDVVVVFAAGNQNTDNSNYSPQNMSGVIDVAAVDSSDNRAMFGNGGSNYGPFVDVSAPGKDILSTKSSSTFPGALPAPKNEYFTLSGTSMAAPYVAGVAALVRAHRPDYSAEDIEQVIRVSAQDIGPPGFDVDFGYGVVRADLALAVDSVMSVNIASPTRWMRLDQAVTSVDIRGKASGDNFASYDLYEATTFGDWHLIEFSTVPVDIENGLLGQWDLTGYSPGNYYLRLVVNNTDGKQFEDVALIRYRAPVDPNVATIPSRNGTTDNAVIDRENMVYTDSNFDPNSSVQEVYVHNFSANQQAVVSSPVAGNLSRYINNISLSGEHVIWHEMVVDPWNNWSLESDTFEYRDLANSNSASVAWPADYSDDFLVLSDGSAVVVKGGELVHFNFSQQNETSLTQGANVKSKTLRSDGDRYIVWVSSSGGVNDIRLLDLQSGGNGYVIASNVGADVYPVVADGKVAWVDDGLSDKAIYVYDVATMSLSNVYEQSGLGAKIAIDNGIIAYRQKVSSPFSNTYDIFAFNLDAMQSSLVFSDPDVALNNVHISGSVVSWDNPALLRIQYINHPWAPDLTAPTITQAVVSGNQLGLSWSLAASESPFPEHFKLQWLSTTTFNFGVVDLPPGTWTWVFGYGASIGAEQFDGSGNYWLQLKSCDENGRCGSPGSLLTTLTFPSP